MISCDVILDLLPLYADDQVSKASRTLIQEHIKECETCAAAAKSMAMPLEIEPQEKEFSAIEIMRRQRRKLIRRVVLACMITAFVCFFSWWIYMETHFVYETPVVVSESAEEILEEVPQMALTQAEKDFSEALYAIPILRDAVQVDEMQVLEWDSMRLDLAPVLPEDAEINEVSASANAIYIDYHFEENRYTLVYIDPNNDNTVDMIRKYIADGNATGKGAEMVYETEYLPILDMVSFEKQQLKHIWFGFLRAE